MTVLRELRHRPAVHQLCAGAFLQEMLPLGEHVTAVPLKPLGFDLEAHYAATYAREVVGAEVDEPALEQLKRQGTNSIPIIAIVVRNRIDAPAEEMERVAGPFMERARMLVAWLSGELPKPFALITASEKQTFFRMIPYQSRRRQRLGFGNTGTDIRGQLFRIAKLAETDERFAFALSMFHDALRELNPPFRAARLFSCLESLAYRVKDDKGSRQRVRKLLGLEAGATVRIGSGAESYEYDRVEIAGRIRDKLFHGVPFEPEKHLNVSGAKAYRYLLEHPRELGDMLLADCELEFARWANGASIGQPSRPE